MKMLKHACCTVLLLVGAVSLSLGQEAQPVIEARPQLDVPYVPTRQAVVDAMLKLANVSKTTSSMTWAAAMAVL
ncbi:hypothetical protein [Cesiribacter andamanensis]|uniref:Uncharacterized protein n=1 Tax=Cesiribacter andamanensis AMV16 TaxID=1279009 RepID=M7N360_9BACT|nr:hypothetical protein [Cesiribacter andamanensis]EMR01717.1 hypothetical protein ADICEAN_03144 [Cesiribacter andamanensis AMV16]